MPALRSSAIHVMRLAGTFLRSDAQPKGTMTASQLGSVHIPGRASCYSAWCSQRAACLSLWWCSVLRWRELVVGAGMEEENLCLDTVGRIGCRWPVGCEREDPKRQKPFGAEYREAQGRTGS
jgi:hypothetical protein